MKQLLMAVVLGLQVIIFNATEPPVLWNHYSSEAHYRLSGGVYRFEYKDAVALIDATYCLIGKDNNLYICYVTNDATALVKATGPNPSVTISTDTEVVYTHTYTIPSSYYLPMVSQPQETP